jgi:hypothetical protein
VPRRPFRLAPEAADEPSVFVVELGIDGTRYTYGFAVDDKVVVEEWLYSYPQKRQRVIFERTRDDIKFGSTMSVHRTTRAAVLQELTRPNALFLSVASRANFTEPLPVYEWFRSGLLFADPSWSPAVLATSLAELLESSPELRGPLVNLLRFADIGISDLRIDADLMPDRQSLARRVTFRHSSSDQPFEILDESHGTRAWLDLLREALVVLQRGDVLVVDEIDTSLHPALTARLLALFQDVETNPKGAQLLCTTHDAALLSPTLGERTLRRSQVWFTEKNVVGETNVYPLSDFQPRKGDNLERRYLGGSYGAVPHVRGEDFADAILDADDQA